VLWLSRDGSNAHAPPPFLVRNIARNIQRLETPSRFTCTLSPESPKTARASPRRREEASDARPVGRHTHRHHRDTRVPRDRDLRDTTTLTSKSSGPLAGGSIPEAPGLSSLVLDGTPSAAPGTLNP
jgi:hypothetical protein